MPLLFSIIIPAYNVKTYLPDCLNSILLQTKGDYEIILINDGSTDGTELICKEYGEKYPYIKILNTNNLGVSHARNLGVKHSSGEYILFIDGDDIILSKSYLEFLEECISKNKFSVDCIAFQFTEFSGKNINYYPMLKLPEYKYVVTGETFLKDVLKMNNRFPWRVWMYVFKKSWWDENNFMFPEGSYYEDTRILWMVLLKAKKVFVLNHVLYGYRKGRLGAITRTNNAKQLLDKFNVESLNIKEIQKLDDINKDLKKMLCDNFAFGYYAILLHADSADNVNMLLDVLNRDKYYKYTYRFPQIILKGLINLFGIRFVKKILNKLFK